MSEYEAVTAVQGGKKEPVFYLLLSSSILITFPNYIWPHFGYFSFWAIFFETALTITAGSMPLCALIRKKPINTGLAISIAVFSLLASLFLFLQIQVLSLPAVALVLIWALIIAVSAALAVMNSWKSAEDRSPMPHLLNIVLMAIILAVVATELYYGFSRGFLQTDENALNIYSAHLFLKGINPYSYGSMASAFSACGLKPNLITPTLSGGYVASLSYPPLSFLALIPASLLSLNPSAIITPFYIVPPLIILYWFRKKHLSALFPIVGIFFVVNFQYWLMAAYGDNDIFWVIFIMLSFVFIDSPALSGIFLAISLSFKQFPALIIPFIIIFQFKEMGLRKTLLTVLVMILAAIAINGYFIAASPLDFINAVIAPLESGIIGIGYGPSQIAFLGLIQVSRTLFTFLLLASLALSVAFYAVLYRNMKYTLFLLPVFILIFNYRLFVQYMMFWPIISVIIIPHLNNSEKRGTSTVSKSSPNGMDYSPHLRKIIIISVVLVILAAGIYGGNSFTHRSSFHINSVRVATVANNSAVTALRVNITDINPAFDAHQVYFRIIPKGKINGPNGYLWQSGNVTLYYNQSQSFMIHPRTQYDSIPVGKEYLIIAYNEGNSGSAGFSTGS